VVKQPTQEEWQGAAHRVSLGSELVKTNSEALNLAVVIDEFDADTFDENIDTEPHVEEEEEPTISESDEETVQPSVDTTPDAPVNIVDEGNEQNVPSSTTTRCDVPTSSRTDWSSYYTKEELMAMKVKLINLQDYLNNKDISHIEYVICDSAIVDDEGNPRVGEEVIKTGQLFESLDAIKFFFQDYAVRHHRPYYVAKSNKGVRYIMRCQICWGLWLCCTSSHFDVFLIIFHNKIGLWSLNKSGSCLDVLHILKK
jgi:hypothetical protein